MLLSNHRLKRGLHTVFSLDVRRVRDRAEMPPSGHTLELKVCTETETLPGIR